MKKLLVALAVAALLASHGIASADESEGKIKSVDETKYQVTMEDGTVYQLGEEIAIEQLKPGQEVKISYQIRNGRNQVEEVTIKE